MKTSEIPFCLQERKRLKISGGRKNEYQGKEIEVSVVTETSVREKCNGKRNQEMT